MVKDLNQPAQIPSPSNNDGGGRIVMRAPINPGPSFDEVWQQHIKQNWRTRDEKPKSQPRRQAVAGRISRGD
jgi:hypothetical protein